MQDCGNSIEYSSIVAKDGVQYSKEALKHLRKGLNRIGKNNNFQIYNYKWASALKIGNIDRDPWVYKIETTMSIKNLRKPFKMGFCKESEKYFLRNFLDFFHNKKQYEFYFNFRFEWTLNENKQNLI